MLKRRITLSKKMAVLKTDKARLLWFYMLPFADIEGRVNADPEDIRDEIIRKQRKGWTLRKIQDCLVDLDAVGLIILYSDGQGQYLQFTRYAEEQTLNRKREAKTRFPSPFIEDSGAIQSNHVKVNEAKRSKVKISEVNENVEPIQPPGGSLKARAFQFSLRLDKYFAHQTKSDKTAIYNLVEWIMSRVLTSQKDDNTFDRVLDIAEKSQTAKKPIAVFFSELRRQVGYNARAEKEKRK